MEEAYQKDIETIISHRYDLGADLWTTEDKRIIKGGPFSMMECATYLLDLGMSPKEPLLKEVAELAFSTWREDGRFQVYPKGGIYPCQSGHVANVLCKLGHVNDERMKKTLDYLKETQYADGGWRCNKFSFGRGEETNYSNPMPTLMVLDAFRYTEDYNNDAKLDQAVEFLLQHWVIKKPIGPCHYGIGTLFMQVAYPFRDYNIFYYLYVLSFYNYAKKDPRFIEALSVLESKLVDGQIVIERVVPKLGKLAFCKKGQPSELATKKYQKILDNLT